MRRMILASALLLATTLALAASPASLEGRWLLVSQTYETGQMQLGRGESDPVLSFTLTDAGFVGTISVGSQASAWPALPIEEGFASLRGPVVVQYDADGRGVRAAYEAHDPEAPTNTVRIEEAYRVSDEGRLVGTMQVELVSEGRSQGAYTWQRVFEREDD